MTPARQPQQEYIITDELIEYIENKATNSYGDCMIPEEKLIELRSRPHTSPQAPRPPCEECIYQAQAASAVKAERERLLDDIFQYLKEYGVEKRKEGYYVVPGTFSFGRFLKDLESLRAQQEQP